MNKKYTIEFKQEAVKLVTEHGYSQAETGRRLGVSDKNINRWLNESKETRKIKRENCPIEEELNRLRKENDRLRMEKEILKKAAAFFANEKS
jgi:transposase